MDLDNLVGIRTRKKWYYNDLGEKVDYVTEVYLVEGSDKGDIEQIFLNKEGVISNVPEVQRFNKPQIKIIKKNNE